MEGGTSGHEKGNAKEQGGRYLSTSAYYCCNCDSDSNDRRTEQKKAALRRVEMELDEADEMVCSPFLLLNPPFTSTKRLNATSS